MNPIIYVDGTVADSIGRIELQKIADAVAAVTKTPIDVMTHGPSKYHGFVRYTSNAEAARLRTDQPVRC